MSAGGLSTSSFLAFDFGEKRVGVATGSGLMRQGQPLRTVTAQGDARLQLDRHGQFPVSNRSASAAGRPAARTFAAARSWS